MADSAKYPAIDPGMSPRDVPAAVTGALTDFFDARSTMVADVDEEFSRVIGALSDFTLLGGKRVRPAFAWAGWLGAGGDKGKYADVEDAEAVFRSVCALEFIQACALIHDDIIDASDTRRGNPTVHKIFEARHRDNGWRGDAVHYGHSVAILAGDIALAWADDMFHGSGLTDAARNRAREPWWRMRTEVLGGQLLDITAEASGDSRVGVAEKVNRYKTAAYTIERPLHIGAAIAGAGDDIVDAYRGFGTDIGIAFQLRDDQLGVFGDPEVTGKPAGDDLREGKRTVLVATALERLRMTDPDGAHHLDEKLGRVHGLDDVAEMRDLIRASGADEQIELEIDRLTRRGLEALESAPIVEEQRERLADMGRRATARAW
ncbi:polyprenyl synthetase family protein [Corynebacterium freneyi]